MQPYHLRSVTTVQNGGQTGSTLLPLAFAAVIILLAAAPSDRPPKAQGPKDPQPPRNDKPKPMKVKCNDRKLYPYCSGKRMECPAACSQSCYADCNSCKPVCVCSVPGACGDPRFIGGDGNAFYFHGRRDADFCVLSDRDLHINAHFIGKRGADGMSRDFTWIQAIAVLFDGGHRLYVGARKTAAWDDDVDRMELALDGEPVRIPHETDATWTSTAVPALSVTRTKAANGVLVALDGRFKIRANAVPITEESRVHRYGVTADDCLAHLDLAFKFDTLTGDVHGVVGQTYRSDYVNGLDVKASMPTIGGESNFTTSASSPPTAPSRVTHLLVTMTMMVLQWCEIELAGLTCASGMSGQGARGVPEVIEVYLCLYYILQAREAGGYTMMLLSELYQACMFAWS